MRDNPIKSKLADGGTAFGTMVFEFVSPGLAQVLVNAGADFVFYDMEHSGFTMEDVKQQCAYCRGLGLVPLVRPPGKAYQFTARLLDLGAMGLLYQMVESAEEAAELVAWTRYPPNGVRGAMFGGAHDDYMTAPIPDTMAEAEARTMVCALIETAKGLANVDAIAAVPGVDVVHLGHADLSLSLGIPGQFDHPDLLAGIDAIAAAAAKHGKTAGCLVGDGPTGRDWMARGYRMVSYSYDINLLGSALSQGLKELGQNA